VRGVIENMSWFTGDDGKRYEIFGAGGGARLAQELGIALLDRYLSTPNFAREVTSVSPLWFTIPRVKSHSPSGHLAATIVSQGPARGLSTGAQAVLMRIRHSNATTLRDVRQRTPVFAPFERKAIIGNRVRGI